MKTALDTNILSTIWSAQPLQAVVRTALNDLLQDGTLVIAPAVYAESLAHPNYSEEGVNHFLSITGIEVDLPLLMHGRQRVFSCESHGVMSAMRKLFSVLLFLFGAFMFTASATALDNQAEMRCTMEKATILQEIKDATTSMNADRISTVANRIYGCKPGKTDEDASSLAELYSAIFIAIDKYYDSDAGLRAKNLHPTSTVHVFGSDPTGEKLKARERQRDQDIALHNSYTLLVVTDRKLTQGFAVVRENLKRTRRWSKAEAVLSSSGMKADRMQKLSTATD